MSGERVVADRRDPAAIMAQIRRFLDFTRPVAALLIAILHPMPDAERPLSYPDLRKPGSGKREEKARICGKKWPESGKRPGSMGSCERF